MGHLILNALLSFAQFEREIISEQAGTKSSPRGRKKNGRAGCRYWLQRGWWEASS
jgi:DNA invertase Pin-like site-specific DNA recombinase